LRDGDYLIDLGVDGNVAQGQQLKVAPVLNETPRHEDLGGSGGLAPPHLTSARGEWPT
jgi:hypothetical protein